jgi:isopenicillin-N epimerase
MTVRRGGVAKGNTIRISPAPYLTEADLDRFIAALAVVSGNRAG